MEIRRTARITRVEAENDVGILMGRREGPHLARDFHLIDLLVILPGVLRVGRLGRQGIVGHTFEIIAPLAASRDLEDLLQREHHLDRCAQFGTERRIAETEFLVARPKPGRKPDGMAHLLHGTAHGLDVARIAALLPVNHRFLETLAEIDAMEAVRAAQVVAVQESPRPVERLLMDQLAQFEQEFLPREVVEPIDHREVVAAADAPPFGPVVEGRPGKLRQLVAEIAAHEIQDARIARRRMVLLQHFEDHHARPPVTSLVALQSRFGRTVGHGSEIAVGRLRRQRPFDPRLHLGDQPPVFENVGQRQQAVDPVGTALPHVAVASEPAVARAHDLRVERIEVSGHAVAHPHKLFVEPARRLHGADRQFGIGPRLKRRPVESRVGLSGCRRRNRETAQSKDKSNRFHIGFESDFTHAISSKRTARG